MKHLDLLNLVGKTAIVTGAAHGIGKASSQLLAAYGAKMVVSDYDLETAEQTAREIVSGGGVAIAVG